MAYNSMSLHQNHMIKGLSCRQEARLQITSLLLSMVLTYTCAIFKTTKTNKTLHQFCGSLYYYVSCHLGWSPRLLTCTCHAKHPCEDITIIPLPYTPHPIPIHPFPLPPHSHIPLPHIPLPYIPLSHIPHTPPSLYTPFPYTPYPFTHPFFPEL